jgi:hypothetical protein
MTIAELHGKLAPDRPRGVSDRMEDLLTSDVFGSLKYAGWNASFEDWISGADKVFDGTDHLELNSVIRGIEPKALHFAFWPKLSNHRESDLALLIEADRSLLILVEAKYLSGMSDWEGDAETDEYGRTGNQIADQVCSLATMSDQQILAWFTDESGVPLKISGTLHRVHILVTSHLGLPMEEYRLAKSRFTQTSPVACYWLSWGALAECLQRNKNRAQGSTRLILTDLYALLKKKGLDPFAGFGSGLALWIPASGSFWREKWWSMTPALANCSGSFWTTTLWDFDIPSSYPSPAFFERGSQ